jgi:hypothetical protein
MILRGRDDMLKHPCNASPISNLERSGKGVHIEEPADNNDPAPTDASEASLKSPPIPSASELFGNRNLSNCNRQQGAIKSSTRRIIAGACSGKSTLVDYTGRY